MTKTLENILKAEGPMLSGALADLLQKELNISNQAVRQKLSRAGNDIRRFKGFFANNQVLFYLDEHVQDGSYAKVLVSCLKESARRVFCLVKSLEFHYGYSSLNEFGVHGFSPAENLKGHKRIDIIQRDMLRSGLISYDGNLIHLSENFFPKASIDFKKYKAQSIVKAFLLDQLNDFLRSTGLISFDSGVSLGIYAKLKWAFTAPCYIGNLPVTANETTNPGFVIADILVGKEVAPEDIQYFLEKLKIIRSFKKLGKFIPILVADYIKPEAFAVLKANGVMIGSVNKLFGNGYADLIKQLINTITNAGAILKKNPDNFIKLMENIDRLVDGKTNNLRGDLFELFVGYFHRNKSSLTIGKIIYQDSQKREIDVFARSENVIVVCECKGFKSMVTLEQIEEWEKDIILYRKWIDDQIEYQNVPQEFEYWSTGGFTEDARKKIERLSQAKKYKMTFLDETAIKSRIASRGNQKLALILKQYFTTEQL